MFHGGRLEAGTSSLPFVRGTAHSHTRACPKSMSPSCIEIEQEENEEEPEVNRKNIEFGGASEVDTNRGVTRCIAPQDSLQSKRGCLLSLNLPDPGQEG